MKHLGPLVLVAMAAWALPCPVQAQGQAYTVKNVHVRAGPARDYPVVAVLAAGLPIGVHGCLPDFTWCDVIAGPYRGWVYAGNIHYNYQNAYVPVLNSGTILGIGVLAFVLEDYWGHNYRNQPWYRERHRWVDRPPAPVRRYGLPAHPPGAISPPPPPPDVIRPRPPQPDPIHPRKPRPRSVVPRPQHPNPPGQ